MFLGIQVASPFTLKSSCNLSGVIFCLMLFSGSKKKKKKRESSSPHDETSSGLVEDHQDADGSDGEKLREAAEKTVAMSSSEAESAGEQLTEDTVR